MLAYDFDYYLPDTLREATDTFFALQKEGKNPLYFGGGTEIISMARVCNIRSDAVIDIKKIPECRGMGTDGERMIFGATLALDTIHSAGYFPLLGLAASRIADHTMQCRITLGGNLAGTIIYHETVLPLMLADADVLIAGREEVKETKINKVFLEGKKLAPGELIMRIAVKKEFTQAPFFHVKKSKCEKIGYPLVSLAALYMDGTVRMAASGVCGYPFRFGDLIMKNGQPEELAESLMRGVPAPILDDLEGSAKYREFILKKTAGNIIESARRQ